MTQKERVINEISDIIQNFEFNTKIVNYGIIFDKRIVLSNNATELTPDDITNYLKTLDLDKVEGNFQKGRVELLLLKFETESLYYIRCSSKVRIIALIGKENPGEAMKQLKKFADQIKNAVEPLSKPPEEEGVKINEMFATIDTMVNEFKIPEFETFKKLVKFALPFKKK
ncbi:MAG: hypothetical protein LUQ65_07755 [Candidatus Helarchaeota archaeon]|nr:hypothetical protein [Candidatus Helarchaeota archaeon]